MPETITFPIPTISQAVYIIAALIMTVGGIVEYKRGKRMRIFGWIIPIIVVPLIPAIFAHVILSYIELGKARENALVVLVESMPEEWNRVIEVLHSEELRTPAKMKLVREHVEQQMLPDLTIKQQQHIVESTFKCACGCSSNCEKYRDDLSELIAIYVNAFPRE